MVFSEQSGRTNSVLHKLVRNTYVRRILALVQGFFFIIVLFSCENKPPKYTDTPTSGEIAVAIDGSFQPVMQAQIEAFMGDYKNAKINAYYLSETEAVNLLLKDSVRAVVMTRQLNDKEKAFFDKIKIFPRTTKVAIDAAALIVNRNNPDSLFTMEGLRGIFRGEIKSWQQIGEKGLKKDITIVFDNSNSSNLSYIKNKFGLGNEFDSRIFAVKSNQGVIDYVESNESALGVIGVSLISDTEDPKQQEFTERIRVAAIADTTNPTLDDYYQPYQAYLALKKYPLSRDLYFVSREARAGLALGFSSFVAGEKGQLVFLKAGLLPATMPIRLVELTK